MALVRKERIQEFPEFIFGVQTYGESDGKKKPIVIGGVQVYWK